MSEKSKEPSLTNDLHETFDIYSRYDEAVRIVRESNNAGYTHLQRRLKIGFNHASILLKRMEAESIISEHNPRTGKRTVLNNRGLNHA